MIYDEICKYLKDKGFKRTSVNGPTKSTFISEDYTVTVIVEENKEVLTAEEEERIKERLRALGYL
jgi:hypothetical protein